MSKLNNALIDYIELKTQKVVPFESINNNDYLPALDFAISKGKELVRKLERQADSFEDIFETFDDIDIILKKVTGPFYNLFSAHSNEIMRALAEDFSGKLNDFENDLLFNSEISSKIKKLYAQKESLSLNAEQENLLEETYDYYQNAGAFLSNDEQKKLRELDKKISSLSIKFSNNLLASRNSFILPLTDKDIIGLTKSFVKTCEKLAREKKCSTPYAVNLDGPNFSSFMSYSERQDLREALFKARMNLANADDEFNNQQVCLEMAKLRHEKAKLLGFSSHAESILKKRMANTPDLVFSFLNKSYDKAIGQAKEDLNILRDYALKVDKIEQVNEWDLSYYQRRYKDDHLGIDQEKLKQYLELNNVLEGLFSLAGKLFNISFKAIKNTDIYHDEVDVYKVIDNENKKELGLLYMDLYPRDSKEDGAWCTTYKGQKGDERAQASIVCNFNKPVGDDPSLLSFQELLTLYHEFGHSLHDLLSECQYLAHSGTNVYWDFVELPSQLMENWCFEKEVLATFAKHHESGEIIPDSFITSLAKSRQMFAGLGMIRMLKYSMLDMKWHSEDPNLITDVKKFEEEAIAPYHIFENELSGLISCSFSHIFDGGYSAGYYSYLWAEVLEACVFNLFKKGKLFSTDLGMKYRKEILAKGGSVNPNVLFQNFYGSGPDVSELFKRYGL